MENKYNFVSVKNLSKSLPVSELSIYQAFNKIDYDNKKGKKIVFDDTLLKQVILCFRMSIYDYLEFQEYKKNKMNT